MDIAHEHRHGLVRGQRHADLDRDAGVGNVGGRAVADAVRPHMRRTRRLEDATPAVVILACGQVLPWMARRRQDVGAVFPPWCRREQPVGFLAQGLRHAAGLAVRPDHPPVLQIDPIPLQADDFGAAAGELELQADRQGNDVVFQPLRLQLVELAESAPCPRR